MGALPLAVGLAAEMNRGTRAEVNPLSHPDIHFCYPVNRGKEHSATTPLLSTAFAGAWRTAYGENPYLTEQDWYRALKIDNKQGIISAAEAEDIIRKLQFTPFQAQNNILIVWLPERMHAAAANKLLKLVEEPPQNTYFFLVTEAPHQIITTIRSRCLHIWVPPMDTEALAAHLQTELPQPAEEALRLAKLSGGSLSKARELAQEAGEDQVIPALFRELTEHCLQRKPFQLLLWSERAAALGKEMQKQWVSHALDRIRAYYMLSLGVPELAYLSPQETERGLALNARLLPEAHQKARTLLDKATEDIERNISGKLVFGTLALDFLQLFAR